MTMLLDGRLRDLATQTHLLETKVSSLGWMAGAGAQTLKSMTRARRISCSPNAICWTRSKRTKRRRKNNEQ